MHNSPFMPFKLIYDYSSNYRVALLCIPGFEPELRD